MPTTIQQQLLCSWSLIRVLLTDGGITKCRPLRKPRVLSPIKKEKGGCSMLDLKLLMKPVARGDDTSEGVDSSTAYRHTVYAPTIMAPNHRHRRRTCHRLPMTLYWPDLHRLRSFPRKAEKSNISKFKNDDLWRSPLRLESYFHSCPKPYNLTVSRLICHLQNTSWHQTRKQRKFGMHCRRLCLN